MHAAGASRLDDDVGLNSSVPRAARAGPLGELRYPRHDQRPRPLMQHAVAAGVLPLRQPPGRLHGKDSGGESHGEEQNGRQDPCSEFGHLERRERLMKREALLSSSKDLALLVSASFFVVST